MEPLEAPILAVCTRPYRIGQYALLRCKARRRQRTHCGTPRRSNAADGQNSGFPVGAGRFWAATTSLVLGVVQDYAGVLAPCLAPKSSRPKGPLRMRRSISARRKIPEPQLEPQPERGVFRQYPISRKRQGLWQNYHPTEMRCADTG